MMEFPSHLKLRLDAFAQSGNLRSLKKREGLDLTSNDYLGFATDPVLRERVTKALVESKIPMGSSGSRLLRGQLEVFENLEAKLASFSKKEGALLFSTGYQAN